MELVPLGPLGDFNDYLDKQLQVVTDASGFLSHDKTKYVFCLLLAYPLAMLFRLLPNVPTLKVNTAIESSLSYRNIDILILRQKFNNYAINNNF